MLDASFVLIALGVPAVYAVAAAIVLFRIPRRSEPLWGFGLGVTATAVLLTIAALPSLEGPRVVMLPLVTLLGGLTLRFSRRYLDGAPHPHRYVGWFLATLAGGTLVVTTSDLVVLALAWTATSLALHQLLMCNAGRAATVVMAHKKFILSRIADVAILSGVVMLVRTAGSRSIPDILAYVDASAVLPTAMTWGMGLIAVGVILRSAQLPFHGWLLQVMEAPTPVSALLHAGIVNIGAFVLLLLAPLLGRVPAAQLLLITAGTLTAALAALAMLAQANVKGSLAWSTCAQMGFVLVQCGFGAYALALLHVAAHALYKGYAFLNSGRTVSLTAGEMRRADRSAAPPEVPSVWRWGMGVVGGLVLVALSLVAVHGTEVPQAGTMVSGFVLGLALAPVLAHVRITDDWRTQRPLIFIALGLPALHGIGQIALSQIAPSSTPLVFGPLPLVLSVLAFGALFVVAVTVTTHPVSAVARALHPHAAAGFHLDALFTRLTFRLWPPRFPAPRTTASTTPTLVISEQAA